MIGLGILGLISFFIFTGLIARFGAIAALVIIFGIFFAIAYRSDKKAAAPLRGRAMRAS